MAAITQFGDLKSLGLCHNSPVGLVQYLLEGVHVLSGTPWWATIMIATVIIRILVFPLIVKAQVAGAKEGDMARAQNAMKKMQAEYVKANVSPFSMLWGLAQAPVFMSVFFALRAMADLPVPGFENGGFLWVTDLTAADPTYILPVVASFTMLTVMEFSMEGAAAGGSAAQAQTMRNLFRGMILITLPITASFPAAVFMYWVSTNFFTLLQFFALKDPKIRKMLKLPIVEKLPDAGVAPGMAAIRPVTYGESMRMVREVRKKKKAASTAATAGGSA
ncbi:Mitochondrial inner membrane protein oxa1l [Blyttiomyces sp. JEL0837]|nr:Mitochondrial inner membrane protein oxa1l [Blyttiomyces sp. JEL0837]